MTSPLKLVVERHADGYLAYPLGLARGIIIGQGDTYEEALMDARSAISFHIESFGSIAFGQAEEDPVLEAFIAETRIPA